MKDQRVFGLRVKEVEWMKDGELGLMPRSHRMVEYRDRAGRFIKRVVEKII